MPEQLKLVAFIVSQLPILGLVYKLGAQAFNARSVLILVAYEIGIGLVAFYRRRLQDFFEGLIADWIKGKILGTAGHRKFVSRFTERTRSEYKAFNVQGIDNINALSLEHVFVELRIKSSSVYEMESWLFRQRIEQLEGNRPIWDFINQAASKDYDSFALAIVGPPGSGKTTLLQNVAISLADESNGKKFVNRAYIPILLFLRELAERIIQEQAPLEQLLQEHFEDAKKFPDLNPPPEFFKEYLKHGKCLVMLDGLDEVSGTVNKKKVSEWVDSQVRSYPRSRLIVTSRPQGYRMASLQTARVLEVMPFNAGQIQRFLENWYLAHARIDAGAFDATSKQNATEAAQSLIARLKEMPALNEMTVNPLLLTMIAIVHHYHGSLQSERAKLYAQLCDVLLERRHAAKKIAVRFSMNQSLAGLGPLAEHMMKNKSLDLSLDQVVPVISQPLKAVGVREEEITEFPSELELSSGLLIESDMNKWSFAHLSFQEYLTATQWLKQDVQNWKELVGDPWWYETIRFYAAQADATQIVEACLEVNNTPSLMLLAEFTKGEGVAK